jgi:predicted lipid-binding transport protein (Tim44 family)
MPLASSSENSFKGQSAQAANIPAGFDTATFLRGAKMNFIKLQAANDAGNLEEIRELATQEMFDVLRRDVRTPAAQHTDVVSLDADLLEVATEDNKYWASVRFSGTVREAPDAAPEGFQEVWNLVKPADGSSGWLLAGIQQMQ